MVGQMRDGSDDLASPMNAGSDWLINKADEADEQA